MKFENVLVLAAHPDDEVLGVGGTIPQIKECGGRVTVVIVTDGSSTQYADDSAVVARKHLQAEAANKRLGTDELIIWDFPDMRLDSVDHVDLNKAFEALIEQHQFDSVFVQSSCDINLDHRLIYESLVVATRPHPGQHVKSVLSYYVNSSTEWGAFGRARTFQPNVYVDISETIEMKLAAMAEYEDELRSYPHPRSLEGVRNRAATHGNEVGYSYAEPFELTLWHGDIIRTGRK